MLRNKFTLTALLPMKAHSERVKGKNFRHFAGDKPLFRWILDTLLAIEAIDQVIINTDAGGMLEEHGLPKNEKIIIRPRKPELCGDFVSMNKVLKDDVEATDSDVYLMTHTTNPLLSKQTIEAALDRFLSVYWEDRCDSLFTVNRFQTRFYREDGSAINHDPKVLLRTQDLEPWYEENSNLYLFTKKSFEKTNARIGERPLLFTVPKSESIDIDDQESWDMAERLAR